MNWPTCKTCPFWSQFDDEGECHRFQPRRNPDAESDALSVWPVTDATQWCGEHPDFPVFLRYLDVDRAEREDPGTAVLTAAAPAPPAPSE